MLIEDTPDASILPKPPLISWRDASHTRRYTQNDSVAQLPILPNWPNVRAGLGMSTIWYAKHAGEVFSVEDYRPWYDKVSKIIDSKLLGNVTYRFAENESEYAAFMSDDASGFDLVVIDGSCRSKCMSHAVHLVKPGGILYLDNSDNDSSPNGGDMRAAEATGRDFARDSGALVTEITDFAPTLFFVTQGLSIKLPG
ncbi:MAG: hypothetical protein WKF77_28045 [Planctomycetaceae bacterium]